MANRDDTTEPADDFVELVTVIDRLRRECPWTAQQSHQSLARYLLEEAHETLDALDRDDSDQLRDELGDVLLQVVFHARIAAETAEQWDIGDVIRGLTAKLIRRNPHVFGAGEATTIAEIDAAWQEAKAQESAAGSEKNRTDALPATLPATLPALSRAAKTMARAEPRHVRDACAGDDLAARFLTLVAEANAAGIDAEQLVRTSVDTRFSQ